MVKPIKSRVFRPLHGLVSQAHARLSLLGRERGYIQSNNLAQVNPCCIADFSSEIFLWAAQIYNVIYYCMANSASGQDQSNPGLLLATRAGKMELSCPLGTTHRVPQEKFPRKPYNKSFIDQFCSVKVAGYRPRSFLYESMDLDSLSVHKHSKKNLANIQPSWPHVWSTTLTCCWLEGLGTLTYTSEQLHWIFIYIYFRVTTETTPNETQTVLDVENAKIPETKVNATVTVSASVNKLIIINHKYTKSVVCVHSSRVTSNIVPKPRQGLLWFEQQTTLSLLLLLVHLSYASHNPYRMPFLTFHT